MTSLWDDPDYPEKMRLSYCPHHGGISKHRLIHHHLTQNPYVDSHGNLDPDYEIEYFVAVCDTCDGVLLYYRDANDEEAYEPGDYKSAVLIWPESGKLAGSVPESIREYYQQAFQLKLVSPTAFAVQIRRALEALCDDRNAVRGTLERRLQELAFKGDIPETLAKVTEVIRVLGNVGAHPSTQTLSPFDASVVDNFFRAVIEYVYVLPHRLEEVRRSLPQFTNRNRKVVACQVEAPN